MKSKSSSRLYSLAMSAAIAAVYAVLTLVLAPISYGAIQFRVSELLCIMPFFLPSSAVGLFIGCLIANLFSPVGILDIIFGPIATLLAGLCTAAIGRRAKAKAIGEDRLPGWGWCIGACACPVIFNALIIGAILGWTLTPDAVLEGFALFALEVGAGEAVVLFVLGLPVMRLVLKNKKAMDFFASLS